MSFWDLFKKDTNLYCKDCCYFIIKAEQGRCTEYMRFEDNNYRDDYGNAKEDPVTKSWMNYGKRTNYTLACSMFRKRSTPGIYKTD